MLKEQIKADVKESMKAGNAELTGVLRLILSAVAQKERDKRYGLAKDNPALSEEELQAQSALTEDEIITVLSSEVKKRRDAAALFVEGGRPELAEKEMAEIAIVQKYLPEQLSADELKKLIEESIAKTGATEMKDMGKVMADLMPKVKGKADNSEISKIIKDILAK